MDHYEVEQVGNPAIRFNVTIDDPMSANWTATPVSSRTAPMQRSNMMIPLRIITGALSGYVAIGATSADGRSVHGKGPFQTRRAVV
jgi:hypothetical protein